MNAGPDDRRSFRSEPSARGDTDADRRRLKAPDRSTVRASLRASFTPVGRSLRCLLRPGRTETAGPFQSHPPSNEEGERP